MQVPLEPISTTPLSTPRLDTTFGTLGTVVCNAALLGNGVSASSIYGVVMRPDRSMVLVSSYAGHALLIALNEDGSLDRSFGSGGHVAENFDDERNSDGINIQLMPDGRLLLTAMIDDEDEFIPGLAMYLSNGQRDRTFGTEGVTIVELGSSGKTAARTSMARSGARNGNHSSSPIVTPKGQILIPFVVDNWFDEPARTVLIRLAQNGKLDTGFHGKGYTEITYKNGPCQLNGVIAQVVGSLEPRLVLAGQHSAGALLAALTLDGEPDLSFGVAGFTDIPGKRAFLSLTPTPDEKLLASGYFLTDQQTTAGWTVRFTADGWIDQSFEPVLTPADTRTFRFERVQPDPDNLILCAGQVISPGPRFHGVLARYLANGQPDTNFGTHGLFEEPEGSFWDILLSSGTRLLAVGGQADNSAGSVRRYELDA